jgi:hypothetical protein
MTTLYEQNPQAWDNLAARGRKNLREMAKHFSACPEMDRALGLSGAACHWLAGRNSARMATDFSAGAWLRENVAKAAPEDVRAADQSATLFLVSTQNGNAERARKLLELIGCEVVEV